MGWLKKIRKQVKRSVKDVGQLGKGVVAGQINAFTLGAVRPNWKGTESFQKAGRLAGYTLAAIGGGYAAASAAGLTASPAVMPAAGSSVMPAASLSPAALAGETAGATTSAGLLLGTPLETTLAAAPVAAGGSSLLSAATTGAATAAGMTVSKLISKGVDTVVSSILGPTQPKNTDSGSGGGGGGWGGAGGYSFTDASTPGNTAQLYLGAAALSLLLIAAMRTRRR